MGDCTDVAVGLATVAIEEELQRLPHMRGLDQVAQIYDGSRLVAHPYQNGRGSVASEKGAGERRKMARNGLPGRCSWFGQMAGKARILRDSDR